MIWKAGTLILAVATFASFIWAIQRFFQRPTGVKSGMRGINVCGALTMLLHLTFIVLATPDPIRLGAAMVTYGMALALFWWTVRTNMARPLSLAYSQDAPEHLVSDGPYAWVRHPFYTSYLLAWCAGCIAGGHIWLWVTVAVMAWFYYEAAVLEEKKFGQSSLAETYAAYQQKTGRFVPRLW